MGTVRPTVFRLTRRRGVLRLDSWQPLKRTSDFTAAGWNSADHRLYVAVDSDLRTYNYPQNALGQPFQISDLTEILGQSQPRVSRHLKLLADAGLVVRNAEGAWAYYRLADSEAAAELGRWLVTELDADDPGRLRDRVKLEAIRGAQQAQAAAYFAKVADRWDELR